VIVIVSGDTVMCGTSGTDRDLVVVDVAGTVARRTGSALTVLHVEPPVATVRARWRTRRSHPAPTRVRRSGGG
jgi:hypothetical protein